MEDQILQGELQNKVEDRTVPVQVLEYYKKYSLNRELPKYFCGAPSVPVSEWHGAQGDKYVPADNSQNLIKLSFYKHKRKPPSTDLENICEVPKITGDDNLVSSRASSVASNRKLEWDNGADIGYNNVVINRTLHKSISLPTLNKFEYKQLRDTLLRPIFSDSVKIINKELNSDCKSFLTPSSSTSSSPEIQKEGNLASTSSSPLQPQLSSDSDSLDFKIEIASTTIQNKIGLPVAESTPFSHKEGRSMEVLKEDVQTSVPREINVDVSMVDKISCYKYLKLLKLTASKSVVVECVPNLNVPKNMKSKYIQTSLIKNISVALQTDTPYANGVTKPKHFEQQSVFYMYHSDSDQDRTTNNCSVQTTDSEMLSNHCQSFEYLSGSGLENKSIDNIWNNTQKLEADSNSPQSSSNSHSSASSPLAQLLASDQSKQRIPDFHKKIDLLQNLLNSRKYNDTTKKFYLKKMLKIMFDTKYSDDSNYEHGSDKQVEIQLQLNKPWEPIHYAPKINLQVQTFSNEIKPQEASGISNLVSKNKIQRNPLFTLANVPVFDDKRTDNVTSTSPETLVSPLNLMSMSSSSNTKTWREIKTRSEQIIEERGSGDFSPKQALDDDLTWINKEILHLHKLKKRLEENKTEKNSIQAILQESYTEDLKGLEQSPTVYVLETEIGKKYICHTCTPQTCKNPKCAGYQFVNTYRDKSHNRVCTCCTCRVSQADEQLEYHSHLDALPKQCVGTQNFDCYPAPSGYSRHVSPPRVRQLGLDTAPLRRRYAVTSRLPINQDTHISKNPPEVLKKPKISQIPDSNSSSVSRSSMRSYTLEIPVESSKKPDKMDSSSSKHCVNCKCSHHNTKPSASRIARLVQQLVHVESIDDKKAWAEITKESNKRQYATYPVHVEPTDKEIRSNLQQLHKTSSDDAEKVLDHTKAHQSNNDKKDSQQSESYINVKAAKVDHRAEESSQTTTNAEVEIASEQLQQKDVKVQSGSSLNENNLASRHSPSHTSEPATKLSQHNTTKHSQTNRIEQDKHGDLQMQDKITQTSKSLTKITSKHAVSSSDSTSVTSTSSSSLSFSEVCIPLIKNTCYCCKRRVDSQPIVQNNTKYILCHPCYQENWQTLNYTNPGHVCKCRAEATQMLHKIHDTVQELNMLEKENSYCMCQNSIRQFGLDNCLQCKSKLKPKLPKKGVAYTLTLEPDDKKHNKHKKKHKQHSLEEVKIKVPSHSYTERRKKRSTSSSDEVPSKENLTKQHKQKENKHKKSSKKRTLQDYLFVNKPDFIATAEERRRCLIDLAYIREQRSLKYKQILGMLIQGPLKNDIHVQNLTSKKQDLGPKHLFTAAEMKQITAKHYKKLPEVQQKVIDSRQKQVKMANKFLTDIFNHKLRQQVLKGKHTIPTTCSIIKLD